MIYCLLYYSMHDLNREIKLKKRRGGGEEWREVSAKKEPRIAAVEQDTFKSAFLSNEKKVTAHQGEEGKA